jgi:hypothetical protein
MPSISVDLSMTRHGYDVIADEVFWVKQGVLRSTDLRDSMDEQCLADIAASIIGGQVVDRSKDALDAVYQAETPEDARIISALDSATSAATRIASCAWSHNSQINFAEALHHPQGRIP